MDDSAPFMDDSAPFMDDASHEYVPLFMDDASQEYVPGPLRPPGFENGHDGDNVAPVTQESDAEQDYDPNEDVNNGTKLNLEDLEPVNNGTKLILEDLEPVNNGTKLNLEDLEPVPPHSEGDGFPYAPAEWPNSGDVWKWKVGKRVSAGGFYNDRYVCLPQRLQKRNFPKNFACKPALERYLVSLFPDMDVNAFFGSFSWKVPAAVVPQETDAAEDGTNEVDIEGSTPSRSNTRKRKTTPVETYGSSAGKKSKVTPRSTCNKTKEKPVTTPASAKQTKRGRPASTKQTKRGRPASTKQTKRGRPASTKQTKRGRPVSTKQGRWYGNRGEVELNVTEKEAEPAIPKPVEISPEEFKNYLESVNDLIAQPPAEAQWSMSSIFSYGSPMIGNDDLAEARFKLAGLLEKDPHALFFSKEVAEVAELVSKLKKDPALALDAEQLNKLNVIEEMPLFSVVYQENKGVIEQADKFFAGLDFNISMVKSLKAEYSELKDKTTQLQSSVDSDSGAIKDIDEQIAKLEAEKTELTQFLKNKKNERIKLNEAQKKVEKLLPQVVKEIQEANSKSQEWKVKKEKAQKHGVVILAKLVPLKDFSL